jgi:hypothetical protein
VEVKAAAAARQQDGSSASRTSAPRAPEGQVRWRADLAALTPGAAQRAARPMPRCKLPVNSVLPAITGTETVKARR